MKRDTRAKIRQAISRVTSPFYPSTEPRLLNQIFLQQELRALRADLAQKTPRNPAITGYKVYSQSDEDGVIANIFDRIGTTSKTFVEFGCGPGTENNTYALLLCGWRGVWIDGSDENIQDIRKLIPLESSPLHVRQLFVTKDNVTSIVADGLARYKASDLDLLSMDLDGNDLHFLQEILKSVRPRVIVSEYNAKFPPPITFTIVYNPRHGWAGDDYHGASLQSLADGLTGYQLVGCNLIGSNAFFVRDDLAAPFGSYPITDLYQPSRFELISLENGHKPSLKPLRDLIGR